MSDPKKIWPSMTHEQMIGLRTIVEEIKGERFAQHAKWGEQNHPNGTGEGALSTLCNGGTSANPARQTCHDAFAEGRGTWAHIAWEEFAEAVDEHDPRRLRKELIQCAAVFTAWAEAIDRQLAGKSLSEDEQINHQVQRYMDAMHGMQTGVKALREKDPKLTDAAELRIGLNSAHLSIAAIGDMLINKGVCTKAEYYTAQADWAEKERDGIQEAVRAAYGSDRVVLK